MIRAAGGAAPERKRRVEGVSTESGAWGLHSARYIAVDARAEKSASREDCACADVEMGVSCAA